MMKGNSMISGSLDGDEVNLVLLLGQSNAVGRAEVRRLQNTIYNPARYVANPGPRVRIYSKGNYANPDLTLDNGVWQDYYAGVNSNTDSSPFDHFGCELSLSQKLLHVTDKDVYIVKCAFGGTGLVAGVPSLAPGTWSEVITPIAAEYFFKRAVRDLKAARPGVKIRFLGVVWWQGESDAAASISKAAYRASFDAMRTHIDNAIAPLFGRRHRWALVGLNYQQTPAEAVINTALWEASEDRPHIRFISTLRFPRKRDMTAAQYAPVALTGYDDEHSCHIAQIAVGELAADVFLGTAMPERAGV